MRVLGNARVGMFYLAPIFGFSIEGTLVNVLSLAKVQMLEMRGGEPKSWGAAQFSDHLRTSAYIVYYVTRIVDWMGAEDIADYGLEIASSDGFYWNFGSIWKAISKSFQSKFEWLF